MLRFTHTWIAVRDVPEALRFYRDLLGFDTGFEAENGAYAELISGETSIAVIRKDLLRADFGGSNMPDSVAAQDRVVFGFAVDDVDSAYDELSSKGVEFMEAPRTHVDWGMRSAPVRDPDGNLLEIYEAAPNPGE